VEAKEAKRAKRTRNALVLFALFASFASNLPHGRSTVAFIEPDQKPGLDWK
jgi:hypothetical protein